MKTYHSVQVKDESLTNVSEGDKTIQSTLISSNLQAADVPENLTLSARSKDKDGKWFTTVMTFPISLLSKGDEIIIGGKILKLI